MKTKTLAMVVLVLALTSGTAMANNYNRAARQTGYFAAGSPALYNPFRGHHSTHWWRVFFLNGLSSIRQAAANAGGGNTGGGKGAPGPVAGAGLPFLALAGAVYLVRRRRQAKASA